MPTAGRSQLRAARRAARKAEPRQPQQGAADELSRDASAAAEIDRDRSEEAIECLSYDGGNNGAYSNCDGAVFDRAARCERDRTDNRSRDGATARVDPPAQVRLSEVAEHRSSRDDHRGQWAEENRRKQHRKSRNRLVHRRAQSHAPALGEGRRCRKPKNHERRPDGCGAKDQGGCRESGEATEKTGVDPDGTGRSVLSGRAAENRKRVI